MEQKKTLAEEAAARAQKAREKQMKVRIAKAEQYVNEKILPEIRKQADKGKTKKSFLRLFFRDDFYYEIQAVLQREGFKMQNHGNSRIDILW